MLTRRIIACLDVRDGVVVKGVQFQNHVALGDPVSLAKRYAEEGADEIVLYDIRASTVGMGVREELVSQLAATLDIPFCVAGGIDSVDKARRILNAGADKISVNTPALQRPGLIDELAAAFGSQCVVIGIDARPNDEGGWSIFSHTGDPSTMRHTGRDALLWIKEAVSRGAGEIVLNCMNRDGTKAGFDLEFLAAARAVCSVPLVASGGAGTAQHFVDVFSHAYVDAALAAGALHRGELTLAEIKSALARVGEPVRPVTAVSPAVWRFAAEPEAASARSQRGLPRRADLEPLDFAKMGGLLPVVVQNADSKEILMLAYASSESLDCSLEQGLACFFSRSRGELWTKGATSGNTLELLSVRKDCDGDALIFAVRPRGPSCHRGVESCFDQAGDEWHKLWQTIERRAASADAASPSYTKKLLAAGVRRVAQKVGEEGVEVALAGVAQSDQELVGEAADLLYHLFVLLKARQLTPDHVAAVLAQRRLSAPG